MSFLSKIFGASKKDATTTTSNWYFAQDKSKKLRQIVYTIGEATPVKSHLSSLIINPHKYYPLLGNLAVGFFAVDKEPATMLMIKTAGFADKISHETVKIAFTFCHMKAGPLFAIFVDSPSTEREIKGGCFIDQVYNIVDFGEMIKETFKQDKLHVVFAQVGGMAGIECLYDADYPIDQSLRDKFFQEWNELVTHGLSLGSFSFEACRNELYERTPVNQSPILAG